MFAKRYLNEVARISYLSDFTQRLITKLNYEIDDNQLYIQLLDGGTS